MSGFEMGAGREASGHELTRCIQIGSRVGLSCSYQQHKIMRPILPKYGKDRYQYPSIVIKRCMKRYRRNRCMFCI